MIAVKAFEKIFRLKEPLLVDPLDMARHTKLVWYPEVDKKLSQETLVFCDELEISLKNIGVEFMNFEDAIEYVPYLKSIRCVVKILFNNILAIFDKNSDYIDWHSIKKLLRRKRIKKGVSILVKGEIQEDLPMEYIYSFKDSSIITIIDFPKNIDANSGFFDHFDTAMGLFAYHMTNIVLAVDKDKFIIYNFNGSHPIFSRKENLEKILLKDFIPKIIAPIRPYKLSDLEISKEHFDLSDEVHTYSVNDLVSGALLFEQVSLYPPGKKISDLPFRHKLHQRIGKMHLDDRNGMSYGYLARQLPQKPSEVRHISDSDKGFKKLHDGSFIELEGKSWLHMKLFGNKYIVEIPDVWVISQRSGSHKTRVIPEKDIVKLGLVKGKIIMQTPRGLRITNDYRPSFDTQVILAHALGNSIISSLIYYFKNKNHKNLLESHRTFYEDVSSRGFSISHWHGYINRSFLDQKIQMYGKDNLSVSCSSPQGAYYALYGKLKCWKDTFENRGHFGGDVHIEPHHGVNINFPSTKSLAEYIIQTPELTCLGNRYLEY